jgi:hypothetical protein
VNFVFGQNALHGFSVQLTLRALDGHSKQWLSVRGLGQELLHRPGWFWLRQKLVSKDIVLSQTPVAHTCNPSY